MRGNIRVFFPILPILCSVIAAPASDAPVWVVRLPEATLGQRYHYLIQATPATALLRKTGGNADWLQLSPGGSLDGTPSDTDPSEAEIQVELRAPDGATSLAEFVIHLNRSRGPQNKRDDHTTARVEDSPDSASTVQFSRDRGEKGAFGHFNPGTNAIAWKDFDLANVEPAIVNAIDASKVQLSGSVLIVGGLRDCAHQMWKVVTETTDSSNILIYGPTDLNFYCEAEKKPENDGETNSRVLIVLPVHAIWANIVGYPADTSDPSWKPGAAVPEGHECNGSSPSGAAPSEGIRPCDAPKGHWPSYYTPLVGGVYNRFTQPGATQGSVSLAPAAPALKDAWDTQAWISTRFGPGWAGLTMMYEHDHKAQDDLDSGTAAIFYDLRLGNSQWFWWPRETRAQNRRLSYWGLRAPELNLRFGPEWTPGPAGAETKTDYDRLLNMVGGATVRLPLIINMPGRDKVALAPQPSLISVLPVVGTEQGFRMLDHNFNGPGDIHRMVAGVDASFRWPFQWTHNFLGDKPITLEYSYRDRWLYSREPYIRELRPSEIVSEALIDTTRPYSRMTLIIPASAYLQVRASVQRGSLPPLFQSVSNLFVLGVTFSNPGMAEH